MERIIRWGILGPGRIARRLAAEWPTIEGARLSAVASRDSSRAKTFAEEFDVERVCDSYRDLLADPEVDIVYVAVPHNFHRDLVLQAIAAGKAVFCEKPMGVNAAEAREMVDAARERGVFLMEAVKTRFMPAIRQAADWIHDGRIGKPGLLQAHFCFDIGGDSECRHLNPELAGGALLDLGVYPLTLAEIFLGKEPVEIRACADLAPTGVDATTAITLRYASGAVAQLTVSVAVAAGTHARIWGSDGFIDLPGFNQGQAAVLHAGDTVEEFRQTEPGAFRFEIDEANRCVRDGLLESPVMTHAASLRMAEWQDRVLCQVMSATSRG